MLIKLYLINFIVYFGIVQDRVFRDCFHMKTTNSTDDFMLISGGIMLVARVD